MANGHCPAVGTRRWAGGAGPGRALGPGEGKPRGRRRTVRYLVKWADSEKLEEAWSESKDAGAGSRSPTQLYLLGDPGQGC